MKLQLRKLIVFIINASGPDSMLVVWDASTGIPQRTIFEPHPNGTQALDVINDS